MSLDPVIISQQHSHFSPQKKTPLTVRFATLWFRILRENHSFAVTLSPTCTPFFLAASATIGDSKRGDKREDMAGLDMHHK